MTQVIRKFADLQDDSVGSQHDSDNDSGSDDVSHKVSTDIDDIVSADGVEGNSPRCWQWTRWF